MERKKENDKQGCLKRDFSMCKIKCDYAKLFYLCMYDNGLKILFVPIQQKKKEVLIL